MNRLAYKLSGISLKYLGGFSKANIHIDGESNIPDGSNIFTANHFTRIETVFLPYHINRITHRPVWSLASEELFRTGFLQGLLNALGAVSTRAPHRDDLIITTLLSKNAEWIIFPEGMMVKNKKLLKKNQFHISDGVENRAPHTGAATLALRCEFYRERIRRMLDRNPEEARRLIDLFDIQDIDRVLNSRTHIIPVNITYYPEISRENILSRLIQGLIKEPSKRAIDELMTEGAMVLSDTDINIRFGEPIDIRPFLNNSFIESDLTSRRKIAFDDKISSRSVMRDISFDIMQIYMSRVYAMTTLNYDHIMTGILKHFPYRADGIDFYEFKCKVYYAVTGIIHETEFSFHNSFFHNQIHLLIDDLYQRFATFFDTARQSGVVDMRDGRIIKDQSRFYRPSDFHSVRSENPLLVIANEIEPLRKIETYLKKIAQISPADITRLVKHQLLEKIQMEYDRDYDRFFIEGESKPHDIGQPIFLQPPDPVAGVLLIHGYMAAPAEVSLFARHLFMHGFTVYAPRLKGHGTSPEDLGQTTHMQWIQSVQEAYVVLKHTCKNIFIGGFSTGAGLALDLCSRIDGYTALFAVAPPIRLKDFGSYFIPAIDTWNQMLKKIRLDAMAMEFLANHPENPHINYTRNPVSGVYELEKLMDSVAGKLKTITRPAVVVQSRKDPVVDPKGAASLFDRLGSQIKEFYIFDFDRHGILLGEGAERVFQAIENFLSQWIIRE